MFYVFFKHPSIRKESVFAMGPWQTLREMKSAIAKIPGIDSIEIKEYPTRDLAKAVRFYKNKKIQGE
jgi:hypothetical protein